MNRIERLFAILLLLQQGRVVRAVDLAERFGISQRTVYRDMHALSEMGVPLATLPGQGYELLDTFRLPPLMLTPEEATALFLAGRMLVRGGTGQVTRDAELALHKVAAVLPAEARAQVERLARVIDVYPTQTPLDWDEPHLLPLLAAIDDQQTLHIRYRAYQETAETERHFDPYDLTYADGAWYANGYCHLRRDLRSFRLNRITALALTGFTFVPRQIVPPKAEAITVRVRFNEATLPHVYERQHYAFVTADDDVLVYTVHTLDEIQQWLLGFGARAEVLAPQALRDWLRAEAQRLIEQLT